jgi:hypothetical protein
MGWLEFFTFRPGSHRKVVGGAITGGGELEVSDRRWRREISDGGEQSQPHRWSGEIVSGGDDSRWRRAIAGGGERSQVEWGNRRWRGVVTGGEERS